LLTDSLNVSKQSRGGWQFKSLKAIRRGIPGCPLEIAFAGIISNEQNQAENVGSIERETWEDLSSA